MKKSDQIMLGSLYGIMGIVVLMLLTYVSVNVGVYQDTFYELSTNSRVFMKETKERVMFEDIINEEDVVVIGVTEYIVGLYDPIFRYESENNFKMPGHTRYFSKADYNEGIASGFVVVNNSHNALDTCKNIGNPFIEDVMFCIGSDSVFGKHMAVANLASLDDIGKKIYIDADNVANMEPVIDRLLSKGFVEVGLTKKPDLISSIFSGDRSEVSTYFSLSFFLYGIVFIASFWTFSNNIRRFRIHFMNGGSYTSVLLNCMNKLWVFIIGGEVMILLASIYLRMIGLFKGSIVSVLLLSVVHLVIIIVITLLNYSLIYHKVAGSQRGFEL